MADMTALIHEDTLKLHVSGRIESQSVDEFERLIYSSMANTSVAHMQMDCTDLQYISSSGLRVLLDLKKTVGDIVLMNVPLNVYKLLEDAGITEILHVKPVMRYVFTKDCPLLGQGGHGKVYKLDDDTIVKVFFDDSTMEEIENERELSRMAFVKGIPCAISYDIVGCEEGYGLVYELAGVQDLGSFLSEHPERLQEYGVRFARLLRDFNNTPADTGKLRNAKDQCRDNLVRAAGYFTAEENAQLMKLLDAVPYGSAMLHTDFHPKNVMVNAKGELILIDMADIVYGNPIFDIGGSCLIIYYVGQQMPEMTKEVIGIEYDMAVQLWQIILSTYYDTQDPEKLEKHFNRCTAMAYLMMASTLGMTDSFDGQDVFIVETLREELFPNIEAYCQLMQMPV